MVLKSSLVVVIFLFIGKAFSDYSPAVENSEVLDRYMLTISSRYGVDLPRSFFNRPMHAQDILDFFDKCDSISQTVAFTDYEKRVLEKTRKVIKRDRRLLGYSGKKIETNNFLNLGLLGDANLFYQDSAVLRAKGAFDFLFTGNVKNISYQAGVKVWTDYIGDSLFTDSDYQPYDGINYNVYGRGTESSVRSSDIVKGGLFWDGKYFNLEASLDYLKIGPSRYSPLMFNADYAPVLSGNYSFDLKKIYYTHYFGHLKMQTDKKKYFYMHRFGVSLLKKRFDIALSEVIINGSTAELVQKDPVNLDCYGVERDFELAYLLPFVPMKFVEHYIGDRDNANLSLDLNILLLKNFRFYGEFLLDDILDPVHLFNEDWGNKWAVTLGAQYFGKIGSKNFDAGIEYCHVEPWVYTHFYGGSHNYTHYGKGLGAPLGPNSELIVIDANYQLSKRNGIGLVFRNSRFNRDYRGGDINDVFLYENWKGFVYDETADTVAIVPNGFDIETKEFLADGYKHTMECGVVWKFAPYELFSFNSEIYATSDKRVGLKIDGGFRF